MNKQSVRWAFNFNAWNPSESEILLATSCMQEDEKSRIGRFVFQKDFKASLIGRLLMRKFIASVTNFPYEDIKFTRTDRGKPICENLANFNFPVGFNVSHQGDYAVLAGEVGNSNIGVDVMKIEYSGGKPLNEFFKLMHKHFSLHEWDYIKGKPTPSLQLAAFYRHWCLKESYVKAIGVGITIKLQDISFGVHTPNLSNHQIVTNTDLFVENQKVDWIFEESMLGIDHCVAVALEDSDRTNYQPTPFTSLTFQELMTNSKPLIDSDRNYCREYFKKLQRQ